MTLLVHATPPVLKPGDLIRPKQGVFATLFSVPADSTKEDGAYQHRLVASDDNFTMVDNSHVLMVMSYFDKPDKMYYVPSSRFPIASPVELRGHVVYVLYDNSIWATDVFGSFESFLKCYESIHEIPTAENHT